MSYCEHSGVKLEEAEENTPRNWSDCQRITKAGEAMSSHEAWIKARNEAAVVYRKDREWIKCEDASYENDFKAGADWERKRSEKLRQALSIIKQHLFGMDGIEGVCWERAEEALAAYEATGDKTT